MTIQQEMEQANAIIFHIDLVYGHLKTNNIEELENFIMFNLGTGKVRQCMSW